MLFALLVVLSQSSCGPLCSTDAFAHYSGLLARAQFGHSRVEEAAFLVQDSAGSLQAINWKSGESDRVSYTGPRPEHCLGMMHTHPFGANDPSRDDREEAQRIHLPIVVVTRSGVTGLARWDDVIADQWCRVDRYATAGAASMTSRGRKAFISSRWVIAATPKPTNQA
jgi:proteasome lid subunit RPN8/RPN11